jgi:hypothetical protein
MPLIRYSRPSGWDSDEYVGGLAATLVHNRFDSVGILSETHQFDSVPGPGIRE